MTPQRDPADLVMITGLPRSGTTPMGDALARRTGAAQLYEPMNAQSGDRRITRYFAMPGADISPAQFETFCSDVALLNLKLRPGIFDSDAYHRRLAKWILGGRSRQYLRRARRQRSDLVIWKDPFALFALPAIPPGAVRGTIVTFRDPAAIASSFYRLGWSFDVNDLQERATAAGVQLPRMADVPRTGETSIDSAVWLYIAGYRSALDIHGSGREIIFVHNADLAKSAASLTKALTTELELPELEEVSPEKKTGYLPRLRPTKSYGKRAHTSRRDLSRVNSYYSDILTPSQLEVIAMATGSVYHELKEQAIRP